MADVSDVENVLVSTLAQVIYPSGTGQPSIAATPCKIYRGWPIPANLDADLNAGNINVSVFPQDNEKKTTRHQRKWFDLPVGAPTLTLVVVGNTVTVGGAVSSPLNAAVLVDGVPYVYPVQPADTLTSVASGLAALINTDIPTISSGPLITIGGEMTLQVSGSGQRFGGVLLESVAGYWPQENPMQMQMSGSGQRFGGVIESSMAGYWPQPLRMPNQIVARVGGIGSVVREIKRQKRGFQITFWCPTPALRDAIVPPCDAALAAIDYLSLPDGTAGRILYERSSVSDRVERARLYRRDLFYSVEYGTTQTQSAAQVVAEIFALSGGLDPSAPVLKKFSI